MNASKHMSERQHIVIRASAGAGKTQTLAMRYLKLVRDGADPGQILATTFTRKAAGEILGRVLSLLAQASLGEPAAQALGAKLGGPSLDLNQARRMLEHVTRSMHRVQISTLDSCFHRMAMCYRFELGLGASPRLIDAGAPQARELRRRAIDALLAEDEPGILVELLRQLHHDQAKRSVSQSLDSLLSGLYDNWRQTDPASWRRLDAPQTLGPRELANAVGILSEAGEDLPDDQRFEEAWAKDLQGAIDGNWEKLLTTGLGPKTLEQPAVYRKKTIPDSIVDAYHPLLTHAKAALIARVAHQTRATAELLERFDRHYSRLRREEGVILFADLPHLLDQALRPALADRKTAPKAESSGEVHVDGNAGARAEAKAGTALGSPADAANRPDRESTLDELYLRLDQRTAHLLLDEFQDTSSVQWRILQPIAAEICAGQGAGHEPNTPETLERSFFCVGDQKQAIFGWRGGQAELFDAAVDDLHLPASAVRNIASSYRSAQPVLDAVNRVFTDLADSGPLDPESKTRKSDQASLQAIHEASRKWQAGFVEHHAHHQDRPGYVEFAASPLVESPPEAQTADAHQPSPDPEATHRAYIAQRVAQLAADHPTRTIGVLVAKNQTAVALLDELRRRGVTASTQSGAGLDSDPAVDLILSLLTLADHPGHSAAVFHVLHSPLAGIVGLRWSRPSHVGQIATRIRRQLLDHGYAAVLSEWARQLAPICNRPSVERLTQLIELADQHQPTASLRVRDLVEAVRSVSVADPAPARVQLLTVHKAKGLEFDLTVLAELETAIGQLRAQPIWRYRENPTDPPAAVFCSVKRTLEPILSQAEPAVGQAMNQEQATRVNDDLSSLYVAMTRAKFALYMFAKPLERTNKGERSSKGLTNAWFSSVLRSQLGDPNTADDPPEAGVLYTHGDPRWEAKLAQALDGASAEGWAEESLVHSGQTQGPTAKSTAQTAEGGNAVNQAQSPEPGLPKLDLRRNPGRSWPTMTPSSPADDHAVSVRQMLDPEAAYGRSQGTKMHELLEQIHWFDDFDQAHGPEQLQAVLGHEAVRNALRKPGENSTLWRERPFAVRLNNQLCQGKFDRVVIHHDEAGKLAWASLIDFKTEPHSAAAVRRYEPQLHTYRQALSRLLGVPQTSIETSLLFLTDGQRIPVHAWA